MNTARVQRHRRWSTPRAGALPLILLSLSLWGASLEATPAESCGGLELRGGEIAIGNAIDLKLPISNKDLECIDTIAALLLSHEQLRSLTVAVRLGDADRIAGQGPALAKNIADRLIAKGIARWRISTVVPATRQGERSSVHFAYTLRPPPRPVALILSCNGSTSVGPKRTEMKKATRSALLAPGTWVQTGDGAFINLRLADGSVLRLKPKSLIRIGEVTLTSKLRRRVKLHLVRGSVETLVSPGGKGSSFDIVTRISTAGVRGTTFRVSSEPDLSRVETLTGKVKLSGSRASTLVPAGWGSSVDRSGVPSRPQKLLPPPTLISPQRADNPTNERLKWAGPARATSWYVEIASDAEFMWNIQSWTVDKPELKIPASVQTGKWFWRVTAISKAGFVGLPSKRNAASVKR